MGRPLHVVALNWRDLGNPRAGGAEVHLEEILAYLARQGLRCTLLTSRFPGSPKREERAGYDIVRAGHEYDFNLAVPFLYRRVTATDPADIVLDDINKIPFFSPLFARAPVVAVIPHLMGRAVFQEVNPLLATLLYAAEQPVRPVYRGCRFEVISESTRRDLIARGYRADQISVVLCGVDHQTYRRDPEVHKTAGPSLVYVGRIKRYKAVDHVIRALPLVRARVPATVLTIIGDGDDLGQLKALAATLGVADAVHFAGYVPMSEKVRLLQTAHVAVNPSSREGWGLTNVEANACGTVCVAADSDGLRDSVLDERTGLLYPFGDIPALADRVTRLLTDTTRRHLMEREALAWANGLTWERCGAETLALIEDVVARDLDTRNAAR